MKLKTILLSALLLTSGGLAATATFQEGMAPAKPGPEHEILKTMAGSWECTIEMMGMETKGTYERKLSLDGFWLISDFSGDMMGSAFSGHEVLGWDAQKEKYVSCWVDSMSVSMSMSEGAWDAESKTLTMAGGTDPASGAETFNVYTMKDADNVVFTMHMGSTDSPAAMTIEYTRKK